MNALLLASYDWSLINSARRFLCGWWPSSVTSHPAPEENHSVKSELQSLGVRFRPVPRRWVSLNPLGDSAYFVKIKQLCCELRGRAGQRAS